MTLSEDWRKDALEASRKVSEKMAREEAERTARGVYRGCPVCKQKVLHTCYHDGRDFPSVDLPLPEPQGPQHCPLCEGTGELEAGDLECYVGHPIRFRDCGCPYRPEDDERRCANGRLVRMRSCGVTSCGCPPGCETCNDTKAVTTMVPGATGSPVEGQTECPDCQSSPPAPEALGDALELFDHMSGCTARSVQSMEVLWRAAGAPFPWGLAYILAKQRARLYDPGSPGDQHGGRTVAFLEGALAMWRATNDD